MVIYNNLPAQNALRNLGNTEGAMQKSMERLASGLRVNRAADDAAGFAISESMRRQVRGMATSQRNALDGVSLMQVADGAFASSLELLQRMNELALLAANGDKTDEQRTRLNDEFQSLLQEIETTGTSTTYNTKQILDGTESVITLQIGPESGNTVVFTIDTLSGTCLGIAGLAIDTQSGACNAIASVIAAIDVVTEGNAKLGAIQNRLSYAIGRLGVIAENLQAAESRIRDLDISREMTNFTKLQILQQAGTAMLAQANLAPQGVLQLLR